MLKLGGLSETELKNAINFNFSQLLVAVDVDEASADDHERITAARRLLVVISPAQGPLIDLWLADPDYIQRKARAVRIAAGVFKRFFTEPHKLVAEWTFFRDGAAERAKRTAAGFGMRILGPGDDSDQEDDLSDDSDNDSAKP